MPSIDDSTEPKTRLGRELKTAADGTRMTAQELQEFIRSMRGRSPQEVLGAVANSGLTQGILLSTIGTIALFALFTVVPYFVYGPPKEKSKPSEEKIAAKSTPSASSDSTQTPVAEEKNSSTATEAPDDSTADGQPNAKKALDKLGETETKFADPKSNPLENSLDDLLDGKK